MTRARPPSACLQGVRQRLLDDPVRGQLEARIERPRVALDGQLHRQARRADAGPASASRLVEAAASGPTVPLAEDAEHRRMSVSAWRPASRSQSSAARASSGRRSKARKAPPAWMTITLTWWVTTSCSSRAIRSRSSDGRPRVRSSRSRSSGWARSSSVPRVQAADPRRVPEQPRDDEDQLGLDELRATSGRPARPMKTTARKAAVTAVAVSDVRRSSRSPTV